MKRMLAAAPVILCLLSSLAVAAEPGAQPASLASDWSFRFVPYSWATSVNGVQTVRGRSTKVDASFIDVLRSANSLAALMAQFELRRGALGIYGDVVWSNISFDAGDTRVRSPAPGVVGTVGRSLGLASTQTIVELGAAYEIFRGGAFGLDLLAGTRFWREKARLSFDRTTTVDLGDLTLVSDRAIAAAGWVSWVDPLVGARLRYEAAPGHNLFLRGDVGGFGAGSRSSWQAIGGYQFDFATTGQITWSGVLGYRALSVDYRKGAGRDRFEFDVLQHGPVLGIGLRF